MVVHLARLKAVRWADEMVMMRAGKSVDYSAVKMAELLGLPMVVQMVADLVASLAALLEPKMVDKMVLKRVAPMVAM